MNDVKTNRLIESVGAAWGFCADERHQAQLRAAKARLNAATAKLIAGDANAACEAEAAQADVDRLRILGSTSDETCAP